MKMTDAFIRNITFDWNRGTKKIDMCNKFGIIPYLYDIEELFNNKEALIFYVQIILETEPMPHVVKCYESFLANAQGVGNMKTKLKKEFGNHVKDSLDTMCNHVEKRMDIYRDLYEIDKTGEKINCRNAIMKDLANKLPFGKQYMWLFSAVIIEELKGGKQDD